IFWLLLAVLFLFCTVGASFADSAGKRPLVLPGEIADIYNQAVDLINSKHPDEALPKLKKVLEMSPDIVQAQQLYAGILLEKGRPAEALPVLKRAAELAPDSELTWYNLGVCYQHLGDLSHQVEAFKTVLKV